MSEEKPRKWRLRVTVRVLMIVILILSVALAFTVRRAKQQEAAIARITRLGGIVGYDYNYWEERGNYPPWPSGDPPAPRWLRLWGLIGGSSRRGPRRGLPNEGAPAPQWLLKLLGPDYFRRANIVSLAGSRPTRRAIPDLMFLGALADVRVLHLDSATFADSELAHARPLKLIRFLAEDSSLGDEGLACLADMNELWEIGLAGSRVTDAGLESLARMPRLRFADFCRLKITDTGLARLSRLTALEHLQLAETLVDDAGLAHLAGMGRLKLLDLTGTRVSDAGLVHLKALPALKWVALPKAGVTPHGAADLQRAIPGLHIDLR